MDGSYQDLVQQRIEMKKLKRVYLIPTVICSVCVFVSQATSHSRDDYN